MTRTATVTKGSFINYVRCTRRYMLVEGNHRMRHYVGRKTEKRLLGREAHITPRTKRHEAWVLRRKRVANSESHYCHAWIRCS